MNDKGTIALSSLAIGVSAVGLLSVAELSEAGDNPAYCALYQGCFLGYAPLMGQVQVHPDVPGQYYSEIMEGIQTYWPHIMWGDQAVWGTCEMLLDTSTSDQVCGCVGQYAVMDFYVYPTGGYPTFYIAPSPSQRQKSQPRHESCWFG